AELGLSSPLYHSTSYHHHHHHLMCFIKNLPEHILEAEGGSVAKYKRRVGQWLLNVGDAAAEALICSRYQ
ncbi:hypothetical protein J6590_094858, partial [Homalodisca vitripennis]